MDGRALLLLLVLFAQISAETNWDFTKACSIIDFIKHRFVGDKASRRDLIPLLNNIKRRLGDLKRTSINAKQNSHLGPVLTKTVNPSNRDNIHKKETSFKESKGLFTFKGHKVIHVHDDVKGRLGKWTILEAMERLLDLLPSKVIDADRICRPGPFHYRDGTRTSDELSEKKCLIMGDSISIGYYGYVADMLEGDCVVHHSPWSGDGGTLDTRHILKCLPLLLSSSVNEPVHYDAIIFNSGLHDVDCCNFPREYVPLRKYTENLRKIKKILLKTGAMVAFATSTPVPFDKKINKKLQKYNKAAKKAMTDDESIPIIDLYKSIINECKGKPLRNCDEFQKQPNVHLNSRGYLSLANEVSDGFKTLLSKQHPRKHSSKRSKPGAKSRDSKYCLGQSSNHKDTSSAHRLTGCPVNATCCLNEYSHSFIGCCMLKDAMDCGDSWHCCPKGTVCDPTCSIKRCSCRNAPWESKASRTVFSALMKSLNIFWNKIAKKYKS
ncbi:uncharacterized protein [Montipora capricornis]|uniref:uncharacterized protein n=1 Tax=Montipora capricornis TaxID=246305 RepID=UPI0035F21847